MDASDDISLRPRVQLVDCLVSSSIIFSQISILLAKRNTYNLYRGQKTFFVAIHTTGERVRMHAIHNITIQNHVQFDVVLHASPPKQR